MYKISLVVIVIKLLFLNMAFSQEFEWLIEPIIENVSDVELNASSRDFITIKNKGKQGLLNFENEILAPIDYRYVNVAFKNKLITASKAAGGFDYFLIDGTPISKDEHEQLAKKYNTKKKKKKHAQPTLDKLDDLKKLKSKLKITIGEDNIAKLNDWFDVYSPKKKLLATGTKISASQIINNNYLSIYDQPTKQYSIVDIKSGQIIHTGNKYKLSTNDKGFFCISEKESSSLFSPKGELLGKFKKFTLTKNASFGIGSDGVKKSLYDLNTMEQIGTEASQIYYLHDQSSIFIFSTDDVTNIYDCTEKTFNDLPGKLVFNSKLNRQDKIILSKETLKGVWDLKLNDWIIAPEYHNIVFSKQEYFITSKNKTLRKYGKNSLYDLNGKLIYDKDNLGIYCLDNCFKVTMLDTSFILSSYDLNKLVSYDNKTQFSTNIDGNILKFRSPNSKTSVSFHSSELYNDQKLEFNSVRKTITFNDGTAHKWYIISSDRLLGIINEEGKTILPIEYTTIEADKKETYFKAKRKGLWGLFKHP